MTLNRNALPPAFLVDAVPGTKPLADVAVAARAAINTTAAEMRATGETWRGLVSGNADAWTPRPNVSHADATAADDARRAASAASDAAQRDYQAALRRVHDHLAVGMNTPEFRETQEAIADAAHDRAAVALAALREAFAERDLADSMLPRQRKVAGGATYPLQYALGLVEEYVTAPVWDTLAGRVVDLEAGIRTPRERADIARRLGLIQ